MSVSRVDDGNWTVWTVFAAAYGALRDNYLALAGTTLAWLLPVIVLDFLAVGGAVVLAVEALTAALLSIALAPAIAESLLGHPIALGESLRLSVTRLRPSSFVLVALLLLSIGGACLLLVVPGLFLLALWSVAAPALIAEKIDAVGALKRSMVLTKARIWRIVVVLALYTLIVFVLIASFTILSVTVPDAAETSWMRLIAWVVDATLIALGACVSTVLYCLLRFEKEGITLELVTEALH